VTPKIAISNFAGTTLTLHVNFQTILGTAIPKITDEFHDLNKVSWYGAAYFMTFGGGGSFHRSFTDEDTRANLL
jgi:hypothetical protein